MSKIMHGMTHTPEYRAYLDAQHRCTNPNNPHWKYYGGRGIQFCFDDFEVFMLEVGARPGREYSLDRINNDGHYASGNVRWATKREQQSNQRPRNRAANFGPPRISDLTGQRFGSLVVTEQAVRLSRGASWKCRCDCGTETVVRGSHLRFSRTKSCGCLRVMQARTNIAKVNAAKAA